MRGSASANLNIERLDRFDTMVSCDSTGSIHLELSSGGSRSYLRWRQRRRATTKKSNKNTSTPQVTPIMMEICLEVSGVLDSELDGAALGIVVVKTLDIVDEAMAIPRLIKTVGRRGKKELTDQNNGFQNISTSESRKNK